MKRVFFGLLLTCLILVSQSFAGHPNQRKVGFWYRLTNSSAPVRGHLFSTNPKDSVLVEVPRGTRIFGVYLVPKNPCDSVQLKYRMLPTDSLCNLAGSSMIPIPLRKVDGTICLSCALDTASLYFSYDSTRIMSMAPVGGTFFQCGVSIPVSADTFDYELRISMVAITQ